MIIAELHGKLGEESYPNERSEDALTSNVFGCLRYFTPAKAIVPFVNTVFKDNDIQKELDPNQDWAVDYHFWPEGVVRKREPDLLLYFRSSDYKYVIVIEAKYHSGPSDRVISDAESNKQYGKQLSDQFVDLLKLRYRVDDEIITLECAIDDCYLLYLTANNTKPILEISSSIDQFRQNFPHSKIDIKNHIIWTNWTKIWSVLKQIAADEFPASLIKSDLLALLERKRFKEFSGFTIADWTTIYSSFYRELWFQKKHICYKLKKAGIILLPWFQNLKSDFILASEQRPVFYKGDI